MPTLLGLAAGVGLLHWVAWEQVSAWRVGTEAPPQRPALQVRTLDAPAPREAEPAAPIVAKPAPAPTPPRPAPVAQALAPAATPERPADEPVVVNTDAVLVAAALPAEPPAELIPIADITQNDIPVYRTKLPPPITLGYELSYGRWTGSGELQWRPRGDTYDARLEGRVAGLRIITLASQGGLDSAGLAPVRYTDQRRGRGEQA
ncbi:MAG TPA: hypothetical protein VGD46_01925, partial [Rhizobacter sp.]